MHYKTKTPVRWIATTCESCGKTDECVDFLLKDGHAPMCDCGGERTYNKGDLEDDQA